MVMLPRSRSLTPTYIMLLLPWEYAKTCLFTPKSISYPGKGSKKIIRFLNKCSKIMIYLFSKFIVRGRRSFVKKERKKKREKREKKVNHLYAKKFIIVIKERRKKISLDLHSKVLHKFFSWRESLQEQSRIRLATKYSHTHGHLDLRV
jgi:signal transduction histidine kinase